MIKNFLKLGCIVSVALFSVSCATDANQSKSTGWGMNDPKWGGFQSMNNYLQPVPLRMVFVEGGTFVMGNNQDNLLYEYDNIPRRVTVSSFYMDEYETSNEDYQEYLYWLQRIYGQDFPEVISKAQPDDLIWNDIPSFRDALKDYFIHPAFKDHPVVGITWEQANDYCKWRTDRVNEKILIDAGIIKLDLAQTPDNNFNTDAYLAGQYNGIVNKGLRDMNPNAAEKTRGVQKKDGIFIESFRLPTEAEWEYAAFALQGNTANERVLETRIYPWNGSGIRASNAPYRGYFMANASRGAGDMMGTAGALNDGAEYTAPVHSYFPNDLGLYNMAGNVAEWCLDVYRPLTFEDANELNPFRGNIYQTPERDEEGQIAEKDDLGRIKYRDFTPEELANRTNFKQSDNRNYDDGDMRSAIADDWLAKPEDETKSTTSLLYEYGKNSLISDKSRVVKGGSWKDRAYYLAPSRRRFLEQDQSANWIGFRCAMSRVGSANGGQIMSKR
ncbi:MAG: SUMF1/EgtB/PvdO family nonheme iron enzyme [Bacteroidales bacterium]|jgi:gliding motility-associated lipoprotein GldJ|nr:SUMF1/EgtB/PvdO family nonheme iron enzyme [Bacteroidales bacterium]